MTTVDTDNLAAAVRLCFANARDLQFSTEQRQEFLFQGKRLRGALVNLISAQFDEGITPEVNAANSELRSITRRLKDTKATLERYAETVERISNLVGALDGLLKLVAKFV